MKLRKVLTIIGLLSCIAFLASGSLMFFYLIGDRTGFFITLGVMLVVMVRAMYFSDFFGKRYGTKEEPRRSLPVWGGF